MSLGIVNNVTPWSSRGMPRTGAAAATVINYTVVVTSRRPEDKTRRRREHESATLSSSKSNTLITAGPLRNVKHATPGLCSHVVKHHRAHACHSPCARGVGDDQRALNHRSPYQVGERQNAIVLSQEVGTEHATTEGQEAPGEGLVVFSLYLGARRENKNNVDSHSPLKTMFQKSRGNSSGLCFFYRDLLGDRTSTL